MKTLSIGFGILVSAIAILNGAFDLYKKYYALPTRNESLNIALVEKEPIFSKTVEIKPDNQMDMRIKVSFRIFETGDMIIESGERTGI